MIGAGDPMIVFIMAAAMREALRRRRGERRLADWLGFMDCAELIRDIRGEARAP